MLVHIHTVAEAVVFLGIWAFLGFIGYRIGQTFGRATLGIFLGFMLGIPGLLILLFIRWITRRRAARRTTEYQITDAEQEMLKARYVTEDQETTTT